MDLIVLITIMVLIVVFFKDLKFFIYGLGIIEIFFRILTFIKINIGVPEISTLIGKYVPSSIIEIIGRYSTGLFYTILIWAFLTAMVCFEVYLIKGFFKRK